MISGRGISGRGISGCGISGRGISGCGISVCGISGCGISVCGISVCGISVLLCSRTCSLPVSLLSSCSSQSLGRLTLTAAARTLSAFHHPDVPVFNS